MSATPYFLIGAKQRESAERKRREQIKRSRVETRASSGAEGVWRYVVRKGDAGTASTGSVVALTRSAAADRVRRAFPDWTLDSLTQAKA